MLSILVTLLIFAVVFAIAYYIINALGLPDPWGKIILAILGLIFLIYLLGYVFWWPPSPRPVVVP